MHKVYATAYCGGRVIVGENKAKTHPLQAQYADRVEKKHIHAEIDLLVKLKNQHPQLNLRRVSVIVERRRKDGRFSCAKPCPGCQRALWAFEVGTVSYTDWDGELKRLW